MEDRADPVRVAVIAGGAGAAQGVTRTLTQLREREIAGYKLELVMVETLSERRYDLVHVHTPAPVASAALEVARAIGLPVACSYHAEMGASALYAASTVVLSPSGAGDRALRALGLAGERIARWEPGVDCERFNPAWYVKRALSPPLIRLAARASQSVMRVDVHPADFDLPGHVATLEALLERAAGRTAVTYDELLG